MTLKSKVIASMVAVGAIMGPIMPSIAMASTPAWAMDGKANNPERYFGKSVW